MSRANGKHNGSLFKIRSRVQLRGAEDAERGVMFDSYTATLCACNGTAWLLLKALRGGARLDALSKLLVRHFDVSESVAQKDVMTLLKELKAMGLVEERT